MQWTGLLFLSHGLSFPINHDVKSILCLEEAKEISTHSRFVFDFELSGCCDKLIGIHVMPSFHAYQEQVINVMELSTSSQYAMKTSITEKSCKKLW